MTVSWSTAARAAIIASLVMLAVQVAAVRLVVAADPWQLLVLAGLVPALGCSVGVVAASRRPGREQLLGAPLGPGLLALAATVAVALGGNTAAAAALLVGAAAGLTVGWLVLRRRVATGRG